MKTNQIMIRPMDDFTVSQRTKNIVVFSFYNSNKYEIHSDGTIVSLNYNRTGLPKPLKQFYDKNGYACVAIYVDKQTKRMKVHRLVAMAFIPNPNNLPQINHKDENKSNNQIDNLEWCDCSYNINYGTHNDRISKAMTNGKLSKRVAQIKDGVIIRIFESVNEAQRNGFNQASISKVASNVSKYSKYKTHKGFEWKYI